MFGIMVGSFASGPFISKGRRTAIIYMIFVSWVGFALSMVLNINCIMAGRFLVGFAAGVSNGCASKSISECVNKKMSG
jgi:MFS family permease